jgi:DNA-directed RNA polymerase subunit beta'
MSEYLDKILPVLVSKLKELLGLKENVIVGHLIPAGTGQRPFQKIIVGSLEEYEKLSAEKERSVKKSKEAVK